MADEVPESFKIYYNNYAYNIVKFMQNHPGGTNTLRYLANQDITRNMELYGHSKSAYRLLQDYKISQEAESNGFRKSDVSDFTKKMMDDIDAVQKIEELVDWSKPMLSQLNKLGPHYKTWIDYPVDKKLRMFESPILESMTFTPWYLVPIFWIPIITYLLFSTYNEFVKCTDICVETRITKLQYVLQIFFGVILWSLLEYSIHRWVFHSSPGNSLIFKQLHFLIHGLHHKVPFDNLRQVFPPLPALFIALVLYRLIKIFSPMPLLTFTGGLCGYLVYDLIHFYIHYGSPEPDTILYTLKRYHANHHFVNADWGFGISSKFWDMIFGTTAQLRSIGFNLTWR